MGRGKQQKNIQKEGGQRRALESKIASEANTGSTPELLTASYQEIEKAKKKSQYIGDSHKHAAFSIIESILKKKDLADLHGVYFEDIASFEEQELLKVIYASSSEESIALALSRIDEGKKPLAPSIEAWWYDEKDQYLMPSFR